MPELPRRALEARLLETVNLARTRYERASAEAKTLTAIAFDSLGTADGTTALQRVRILEDVRQAALSDYREALRVFGEFVISGKMPPDWQ